jgi:hypothetical protein
MTIVLGAIADQGKAMVTVSDRMLSVEEPASYQFEHESTKVRQVGRYLVGYSGPTSFADDLLSANYASLERQQGIKEFIKELSVAHIDYTRALANRILLEPFGLSLDVLNQNPEYYDTLRDHIYETIRENPIELEFIVCGYDGEKPKIYLVGKYGVYSSAHAVGYAAVGIGTQHALNFYMVNRFKFGMPLREAVFFAFRAKKSTEISAGIGKCTDICVLERRKEPVFYRDGCRFISSLDSIYLKHQGTLDSLYQREVVPALNDLDMEESDEVS